MSVKIFAFSCNLLKMLLEKKKLIILQNMERYYNILIYIYYLMIISLTELVNLPRTWLEKINLNTITIVINGVIYR